MFLSRVKKISRQVGVRMTLWHLGLLIFSSCFLFAIFYFIYSQSLQDKDHEVLQVKFKEYNAIYHAGGIKALDEYVRSPNFPFKDNPDYFVRIESAAHNTLYFHAEGTGAKFDMKEIEHGLYDLKED
ncbi:MAG: hypothetical protein ACXVCE_18185, partial [Bacteriovorax sp.]